MPTIELDGSSLDPGWIMATMLFPNDAEMRECLFTVQCTELEIASLSAGDKIEVDVGTIERLIRAPSRKELGHQIAEATKRATYAGDILASIYLMDRFNDKSTTFARPSMGKALHVAKQFGLVTKFGDGEQMYYSDKKIRDCWAEFESVAHLWAAFRIGLAYPLNNTDSPFKSQEATGEFLSVAAGMYAFGSAFVPKGARPAVPVLDVAKAWTLPTSILPSVLISDRMPDELAKYLGTYKA